MASIMAAAPLRSQTFLDAFMSDARLCITSFLQLDEFANLALVCKATAGVVSGRTIGTAERKSIFARFVAEPMLATLKPIEPAGRMWFGDPVRQEEHDAKRAEEKETLKVKYDAWLKLPIFERVKTWKETNTALSSIPTHDYVKTLDQVQYESVVKCHDGSSFGWALRPLVEFMNEPIHTNGAVIRRWNDDNVDVPMHITHGSVIMRVNWYNKQYPSWVQYLLTTPAALTVRNILDDMQRHTASLTDGTFYRPVNPYTPLMAPLRLVAAQFCSAKGRFTKDTKTMSKKHWEELSRTNSFVYKLRQIYDQYKAHRTSQFEADLLIPKILSAKRGEAVLSDWDLSMVLQILQRNRPSKRRRRVEEDRMED